MGLYSEKTQRILDKYLIRLVRKQPVWLRDLFDTHRINFYVEPTGELRLEMSEKLDPKVKEHACFLVEKYLAHHPSNIFSVQDVN